MTKVVHCKKEKYDIYIGRPSIFGNPFEIGKDGNREEVIEKYKNYFYERLKKDNNFWRRVWECKGKVLGCWCVSKSIDFIRKEKECHGEIILEYLEKNHD